MASFKPTQLPGERERTIVVKFLMPFYCHMIIYISFKLLSHAEHNSGEKKLLVPRMNKL